MYHSQYQVSFNLCQWYNIVVWEYSLVEKVCTALKLVHTYFNYINSNKFQECAINIFSYCTEMNGNQWMLDWYISRMQNMTRLSVM